MNWGRTVEKVFLRVNQREVEEVEDIDGNGWKMNGRIYR
jgi:hypothetical protein